MNRLKAVLTPRFADGQPLWNWWLGELWQLIPQGVRAWWVRRGTRLWLVPDGPFVALRLVSSDHVKVLGRFPLDGASAEAVLKALHDAEGLDVERVLICPPARVLRRRITLPVAARPHLRAMMSHEIERYTPYRAAELYFDVREHVDGQQDGATFPVEFAATPRDELDVLLDVLAVMGIRPDRLDVVVDPAGSASAGFNLLPRVESGTRSHWILALTAGLSVLLCTLLVALGALPAQMDETFVDDLHAEERRLLQASRTVEDLREQMNTLAHARMFVLDHKIHNPSLLAVLDDVSRRLPDDAWVASLQVREKRLEMQGYARSASTLIGLIEASPYLNNTSFLSPVTPDPATGQERFRVGADLVMEAAGDEYHRLIDPQTPAPIPAQPVPAAAPAFDPPAPAVVSPPSPREDETP